MTELVWLLAYMVGTPFMVFFSVKLGRYAYLCANETYRRNRRREQFIRSKKHGQ